MVSAVDSRPTGAAVAAHVGGGLATGTHGVWAKFLVPRSGDRGSFVNSHRETALGCLAVIILEQAAETLAAGDGAIAIADIGFGRDELIAQTLMVSLGMIVRDVLIQRVAERLFADEDHLVEAFFLDRADETFAAGVQVRAKRLPGDMGAR